MIRLKTLLDRLLPDRFLAVMVLCIAAASLFPAQGAGAALLGVAATGAVALLFFLYGVRLSRETLIAGLTHWRLHLLILAITFILFPIVALVLAALMPGAMPAAMWGGVIFLCLLPSTVQSSVAFTSIARGNVAAALCSAAASNLLGVLLTPLLVGLVLGARGHGISASAVGEIALQILAPFVVGHVLRPWLGGWAARHAALLRLSDRGTILLSVYSAFSAAVIGGLWATIAVGQLAVLAGVCVLILAIILLSATALARLGGFNREDEIAIMFCGSKKSIINGIPMARVLIDGPALGMTMLPIMIFHQIQLMVSAWIARRYERAQLEAEARAGLATAP